MRVRADKIRPLQKSSFLITHMTIDVRLAAAVAVVAAAAV